MNPITRHPKFFARHPKQSEGSTNLSFPHVLDGPAALLQDCQNEWTVPTFLQLSIESRGGNLDPRHVFGEERQVLPDPPKDGFVLWRKSAPRIGRER